MCVMVGRIFFRYEIGRPTKPRRFCPYEGRHGGSRRSKQTHCKYTLRLAGILQTLDELFWTLETSLIIPSKRTMVQDTFRRPARAHARRSIGKLILNICTVPQPSRKV